MMKKVIVIGCPGGGKSTFSRALQTVTGLPLHHLDQLYWNADRTAVSEDILEERIGNVLQQDAWILDGDYHRTLEMRLRACDTVFFLDYSAEICLAGITARLGVKRPDMPWVEEKPDPELFELIHAYSLEKKPDILRLLQQYPEKQIVIFRDRDDASSYLLNLQEK